METLEPHWWSLSHVDLREGSTRAVAVAVAETAQSGLRPHAQQMALRTGLDRGVWG